MTLLNYAHVGDAIDSIVALQEVITADVGTILGETFTDSNAKPFMRYNSSIYPRWQNGLSKAKPEPFGIYEEYDPMVVQMELQLGSVQGGGDGKLEQTLYVWIPYTLAMFRASPRLQSDAKPAVPYGLLESAIALSQPLMPGEVIAAQFLITLHFAVTNAERDY